MLSEHDKSLLINIVESIKFKIRSENLSFDSLFNSKDFLCNGYLKYSEIRQILEKELAIFHPNRTVLQIA